MVKNKDNDITVAKTVGPPIELFNTISYDRMTSYNASVLAGHCRSATSGGISRKTAHPFENDNLVGMHNGTLTGWRASLDDSSFFDVDSECLFHNIAENGVDKVIPKVKGAYALVWFDKTTGVLNFLRNSQRPLWTCMTEDKEVMFWASEYWMLDMLRSEHGKRQKFLADKDENQYFELPENTLTRFRVDTTTGAKKVFTKLPSKTLEGDSSQPTYTAPFQRGGYSNRDESPTTAEVITATLLNQDQHWEKVWGDIEWNEQVPRQNQTPLLITGPEEVKEVGKSLMQKFKEKVLNGPTPNTSSRITQIGPIPPRELTVPLVDVQTTTQTSGMNSMGTPSPKANKKVPSISKGTPTRKTNTLTLVSSNKESTSESSNKQKGTCFVSVCQTCAPIQNFKGDFQTFQEFAKSTGGCCASCDEVLTRDDFINEKTRIAWINQDAFLCDKCNTVPLAEPLVNQKAS